ncbi:MAG: 8-amino-7-oxononanoate synthase [Endomicrobia bacterium]|nr:8-amino-7-oxononanoate synthase [Endomicrobiia bacterium]MCL2507454.1 8-amino-7-oxononanoate synthase [Endomicrobiia bacterium]
MLDENLSQKLSDIQKAGLLRKLRLISSIPAAKTTIDNKEYINFSSNNYLDLADNKEINAAARDSIKKYGMAGASSRLVGGNLSVHEQLETELAAFKNKQAALVFPSGYQANVGVVSTLASKTDNACIIMDKLNHASLWDGAKLSGARIFVYDHCDMDSLESVLKRTLEYKLKLAITESVFSMDGDLAPLKDFTRLCKKYDAVSMVDEAHCSGVFGKEGRGLVSHFGIENQTDIITGTLSKAFALQGGFVCGSQKLIDYLINKSRAFIYTTAISPAIAGAALKSLEIIKKSDDKRVFLLNNARFLKNKLNGLGFDTSNSESQILPVITGSIEQTEKLSKHLFKNFIFAPAIKPPTVPEGQARIRISLTAGHDKSDIEKLLRLLS